MTQDEANLNYNAENILDSIADGVYVTDLERKIVFWNQAAERITGWRKQDVLGKSCMDQVLCHVDKENRALCGKDACPLYRAIATGKPAMVPVIIYALCRSGERLPVQVNVAPLFDKGNRVIGGVEVFRDMSDTVTDLARAKEIQTKSLKWDIGEDCGLSASVHYLPHDIIGGDFYALTQLSAHRFVFLLADVMGHGTSAALYTMYMRSLWEENFDCFPDIATFAGQVNKQLHHLMSGSFSFAAAVCGLIDLESRVLSLAGGALPSPFLFKRGGVVKRIDVSGLALGMMANSNFAVQLFDFNPGDILFLYTDGAVEIVNQDQKFLDEDGLLSILQRLGYPHQHGLHQQIEEQLLGQSTQIILPDDITFLELRYKD